MGGSNTPSDPVSCSRGEILFPEGLRSKDAYAMDGRQINQTGSNVIDLDLSTIGCSPAIWRSPIVGVCLTSQTQELRKGAPCALALLHNSHIGTRHNLSGRNLSGRNLSGHNLSGHNLSGHNLYRLRGVCEGTVSSTPLFCKGALNPLGFTFLYIVTAKKSPRPMGSGPGAGRLVVGPGTPLNERGLGGWVLSDGDALSAKCTAAGTLRRGGAGGGQGQSRPRFPQRRAAG